MKTGNQSNRNVTVSYFFTLVTSLSSFWTHRDYEFHSIIVIQFTYIWEFYYVSRESKVFNLRATLFMASIHKNQPQTGGQVQYKNEKKTTEKLFQFFCNENSFFLWFAQIQKPTSTISVSKCIINGCAGTTSHAHNQMKNICNITSWIFPIPFCIHCDDN